MKKSALPESEDMFDLTPSPARKRAPNTTEDGRLACAYGTPWLDHWQPPLGTGKGCASCDDDVARLVGLTIAAKATPL